MVPVTANRSPLLSTAQAIRASLFAKSDNGDIVMGTFHERFRPPPQRRVTLSYMRQRRARSMDQLLAEICITALANSEQLRFTSGGELTWDHAKPGRKIAAPIKDLRPSNRGDKRSSRRSSPGEALCHRDASPAPSSFRGFSWFALSQLNFVCAAMRYLEKSVAQST